MKKLPIVFGLIVTALLWAPAIFADISGTWQGQLGELTIQFKIEDKDGVLSAVVNSPSSAAIKDMPVDKISFIDGTLSIEVAELSGSYQGTMKDGTIDGNWRQLDESIPLQLQPYSLSSEDISQLAGRWSGLLEAMSQKFTIIMKFEASDAGELRGFIEVPDQGNVTMAMEDVILSGANISFVIPRISLIYKGKLTDGKIVGEWTQGQAFALLMSRADENSHEYALNLSVEAKKRLMGDWHGNFESSAGNKFIVGMRFANIKDPNGGDDFVRGYINYPDQGGSELPLKKVTISGEDIALTLGSSDVFTGKITDGKLIGEHNIRNQKSSLIFSRGKIPPLYVDIPASAQAAIKGAWGGKLALPNNMTLSIILRFEDAGDGKLVGFIDSPDQGMKGARLTTATLENNILVATSALLDLAYTATLSGDQLIGASVQRGQKLDLNLTRDK